MTRPKRSLPLRPPAAALWPWAGAGLLVALAWFAYVRSVGLPNRIRGDAFAYLDMVASADSITDLLGSVGERTPGLPLFLYAVRVPFELVTPLESATLGAFVDTVALVLLATHVAASLLFFRRMREFLSSSLGLSLPPLALALLIAYPGLVAYTTVPLTDTPAADLMMTGVVLYADRSGSWKGARSAAAGLLLGALVLTRPSALATTAAVILVGLGQALWRDRASVPMLALSAVVWAGLIGWQAAACTRAYGEPCLIAPDASRKALAESISWGTGSARHYWSSHTNDPEGRVTVPDPLLLRVVGPSCPASTLGGRDGLLACLLANPIAYPALVLKKSIGLFDAYQLQPYAVDVTPRWARLASRPFGALAFAGFAAVVAWLVFLLRSAPASPLIPVLVAPVAHVGWHALFHVEARYGLAVVPFSLVMIVATTGYASTLRPARRIATLVGLGVAAVAFLAQTSSWDRADVVLQRIEQSLRQPAR